MWAGGPPGLEGKVIFFPYKYLEKLVLVAYSGKTANGVISTGKSRILAKKLDHHVMLFTAGDDEKILFGYSR